MVLSVWLAAAAVGLGPLQSGDVPQEAPQPGEVQAVTSYAREMQYLDADGDKRIDAGELAAGQQMASMMLMLTWENCDLDGDGSISPAEFQAAADQATQALLQAESESEAEQEAEDALARAVPFDVLLDQLAQDDRYADEIAALREEIEDLEDDEATVTYVTRYPERYPHLAPVVRTWVRHYPVRPGLRRLVKPSPLRLHRPPAKAKSVRPPKPGPKAGKLKPKKPPKAGKKPGAKPQPKRRPPRRP
jgi:hypothetical protein